jgi:hypothetical protein
MIAWIAELIDIRLRDERLSEAQKYEKLFPSARCSDQLDGSSVWEENDKKIKTNFDQPVRDKCCKARH